MRPSLSFIVQTVYGQGLSVVTPICLTEKPLPEERRNVMSPWCN